MLHTVRPQRARRKPLVADVVGAAGTGAMRLEGSARQQPLLTPAVRAA